MKDSATTKTPAARKSVPKPVSRFSLKARHIGVLVTFLAIVVAPISISGWYLFERAVDQYASRVGFSVRAQELQAPTDFLSGIGSLASPTATDTDILYEFIQSQEMVELVDAQLDLRALYSKPDQDPVFSFERDKPIEDLVNYWRRMVSVFYDSATGLIELRVLAFEADDSVAIADEILRQSSIMINRLSAIAREDKTRYSRENLNDAVAQLKSARQALTQFRATTQIVDPRADVQGQMTVLVALQQQLAETFITLDLLIENSSDSDPRVEQMRRQVQVIQRRIDAERRKFGLGGDDDAAFTQQLAKFEELNVDLEFAQTSYLAARANFETAVREAQQQSRYLAAYLNPTRPETAEFPQRFVLLGLIALFSLLTWSLMVLVYYSVRDRS